MRTTPLLALAAAAPALTLAACSGGNGTGGAIPDEPTAALVAELHLQCDQAGVAAAVPPPPVSDALFDLGQALFFDPLLSGNSDVSCATCHLPAHATGDGRTLPNGVGGTGNGPARFGGAVIPRNSPTVLNAHLWRTMFWDSRVERLPGGALRTPAGDQLTPQMAAVFQPGIELLAAQAMFPVTSREEMRGAPGDSELSDLADDDFSGIWSALMDRLLLIPAYVDLFAAAYPGTPVVDLSFAHAGNAIAGFEARAFAHFDSPFDRFMHGDDAALSEQQLRGGIEFFTKAGCARCHTGPAFSDFQHHNVGLAQFGPGKGDGADGSDDFGRERVTTEATDRYRFRTPSLLNVELTAPYGHVGQQSTLGSAIRRYRNTRMQLHGYDPAAHVDDPALIGTRVDNTDAVLGNLDPLVDAPRQFDAEAIEVFLRTLTADGARDLSAVVPQTVPSGLPVL